MTFLFCPYFYFMLNLKNAKIGKIYNIKSLSEYASEKIVRRLFELGFTKGQSIKVVRKSLLGQTILIEIRGYTLSLRTTVAEAVLLGEKL